MSLILSRSRRKGLDKFSMFVLFLLVLNAFWGFIYKNTIYAKPLYEYGAVIMLFGLFCWWAVKNNFGRWSNYSKVWAPYLLFTFLGYAITPAIVAPYWLICLIMLLVAGGVNITTYVPSKLLFWGGIFALIGIAVQMFLPSFYSSYVSVLYLEEDRLESWIEEYGFNGFTYQLGDTAAIIMYSEVALLYMKNYILPKWLRNPIVFYLLLIIHIIGVFLTGKRLLAALALTLPFLVYFFSQKLTGKKIITIFLVMVLSFVLFDYFVSNLSQFSDSFVLRRFVSSYTEARAGHDITSNRSYLYNIAWNVFLENPFWGIGVGQFKIVTGAYTAVHNTYLQVLCEQGIVGFTLFILPIIYSFSYTLRVNSKVKDEYRVNFMKLSLAFQLIYIIYSMTGNENIGSGYIMYFIGIAIAISVDRDLKLNGRV